MMTLAKNDPVKAKEFFEDKVNFTLGPVEVKHMIEEKEDMVIVDVRAAEDYQKGHIPGAINLPKEKWLTCEGLDENKTNIIYCYTITCHLGAKAAIVFAGEGYSVMEMDGGFKAWNGGNFPIEQ